MDLVNTKGPICRCPGGGRQGCTSATRTFMARLDGTRHTDGHFLRGMLGQLPGGRGLVARDRLDLHRHVQATMTRRHGVGMQQGRHALQEHEEENE